MTEFLDESLEKDTIQTMAIGQIGYTVFWAIWADQDRRLWINGNYTTSDSPHGIMHVKIQRTRDGVRVWRNTIRDDERFLICTVPPFVGGSINLPIEWAK